MQVNQLSPQLVVLLLLHHKVEQAAYNGNNGDTKDDKEELEHAKAAAFLARVNIGETLDHVAIEADLPR